MISNQNEDLLEEIYKATKMGFEATQLVIPKVEDTGLRDDIKVQRDCYEDFAEKSEEMLKQSGKKPEEKGAMKKATLWGAIQLNTLADTTTEHLAEIMINGTTMGIVDLTKKLNDLDDSDAEAKKLALDYLKREEEHIDALKKHL
ncbi:MAG TPA: hypothetical protein VHO94_01865 [Oscillospiraceae bacterium]|nr:hypothetical protein [Oscillospiraceae bacterium]